MTKGITMARENQTVETKERELIMTRIFDAPKALLFEVYSSCEHLKNWWGPRQWPLAECRMDFQVGGAWHFCMRGPNEGDESWVIAIYQEIKKPDKIKYRDYFSDKDGNINDNMPGMLIAVDFFDLDGKTKVRIHTLFDSAGEREKIVKMGAVEGMSETLDRLDEHLAAIQ